MVCFLSLLIYFVVSVYVVSIYVAVGTAFVILVALEFARSLIYQYIFVTGTLLCLFLRLKYKNLSSL
jgi:hypothetical protein